MELRLRDAEAQVQSERSVRLQMSSQGQHADQKLTQLERQISDLSENLKSETDMCNKYKKSYTELQQVRTLNQVVINR